MRRHVRALAKASGDGRTQADVATQHVGSPRIACCGFVGFQAGIRALPVIGQGGDTGSLRPYLPCTPG
eukprot:515085-Alexandrium_andersonii.AAC.1